MQLVIRLFIFFVFYYQNALPDVQVQNIGAFQLKQMKPKDLNVFFRSSETYVAIFLRVQTLYQYSWVEAQTICVRSKLYLGILFLNICIGGLKREKGNTVTVKENTEFKTSKVHCHQKRLCAFYINVISLCQQ